MNTILTGLIDHLITPRCHLCQTPCDRTPRLCLACLATLPWLDAGCRHCATPLPAAQSICGTCLHTPPPYTQCHAAFTYTGYIKDWIQAFKYQQRLDLAPLLAGLFCLSEPPCPPGSCLIPVPMHPKKRFTRGYNPSLRLASHIARHTAQRVERGRCQKIKPTAAQFSLKASERKNNLKNAFACKPLKGPVILLDDVISTGSTVKAVSASLLQAGAASVTVWAIANNIKDGINDGRLNKEGSHFNWLAIKPHAP